MADLFRFLTDNQIETERHDHPPVFTVADVERLVPTFPAVKTKNLFLRDKKGRRHFLVAVPALKRVNIQALGACQEQDHTFSDREGDITELDH